MSAQHTPGTLEAHTDGKTWWVQTPAPERTVIAVGLSEQHARLIATAPDFLPASLDAVELLEQYAGYIAMLHSSEFYRHPYLPEIERVSNDLRAAIAKAEGRS